MWFKIYKVQMILCNEMFLFHLSSLATQFPYQEAPNILASKAMS